MQDDCLIQGPWKLRIINPKISKFVPVSAMLSVEGKKILITGLGLPCVDPLSVEETRAWGGKTSAQKNQEKEERMWRRTGIEREWARERTRKYKSGTLLEQRRQWRTELGTGRNVDVGICELSFEEEGFSIQVNWVWIALTWSILAACILYLRVTNPIVLVVALDCK